MLDADNSIIPILVAQLRPRSVHLQVTFYILRAQGHQTLWL